MIGLSPCSLSRSIPACAGKPRPVTHFARTGQVDPRVRGEAIAAAWEAETCTGRSPRARGSLPEKAVPSCDRGSIPACAGKPPRRVGDARRSWVDPRVRGEARVRVPIRVRQRGRSPRARGSRPRTLRTNLHFRSIPACAGKPLDANLLRVERKPNF